MHSRSSTHTGPPLSGPFSFGASPRHHPWPRFGGAFLWAAMSEINLPNFSAGELRCKGSGILRFAPGFAPALQGLRDALTLAYVRHGATPEAANRLARMVITSACRSLEHNTDVGGHPRSLHICDHPPRDTGGCCAVDVRADAQDDHEYRALLIRVALDRGWSVGHHPRFLHLDLRTEYTDLPQAEFNY